jgi:hypothetical protein
MKNGKPRLLSKTLARHRASTNRRLSWSLCWEIQLNRYGIICIITSANKKSAITYDWKFSLNNNIYNNTVGKSVLVPQQHGMKMYKDNGKEASRLPELTMRRRWWSASYSACLNPLDGPQSRYEYGDEGKSMVISALAWIRSLVIQDVVGLVTDNRYRSAICKHTCTTTFLCARV